MIFSLEFTVIFFHYNINHKSSVMIKFLPLDSVINLSLVLENDWYV